MNTSGKTRILIAGILVSLFIIILFINFSNVVSEEALKSNQELLQEISARSAAVLRDKITLDIKLLRGIADNIREESELVSPKTFDLLRAMAKQTEFVQILIVTADGKAYLNESNEMSGTEEDILRRVLAGETIVSGVFHSKIDDKTSNAILVPIYDRAGQTIGVLCGIHPIERWSNMVEYSFGYNQVYFHVVDSDDKFVIRSKKEILPNTLHELFSMANFEDDFSHEKIHEEMEQGKSGFAIMNFSGNILGVRQRYVSYAPVDINNWYVFALVPQNLVAGQSEMVKTLGKELLLKVVILFFILITFITLEMSKTTRAISLSKERYRIAVEKSDTIIFDYDIHKNIMYNSAQLEKNFDILPGRKLHIYDICHDEDVSILENFVQKFYMKKIEMSVECRLKCRNGEYKWNKFSVIPIFDSKNNLIEAIGILEDITNLKETEQKLLQSEQHSKILKTKAERDYLTDLYNKGTVEYLISSILQEDTDELQALIIIDLDNFKAINDNFGHAIGDDVLREVANRLKTIFRNTDIISRIGGDEFVVFLRAFRKKEIVISKMQEVCDKLIFIYTKDEKEYKVSASVGCSFYPEHGKNFGDLCEKADCALYVSKRNKKGTFNIYC